MRISSRGLIEKKNTDWDTMPAAMIWINSQGLIRFKNNAAENLIQQFFSNGFTLDKLFQNAILENGEPVVSFQLPHITTGVTGVSIKDMLVGLLDKKKKRVWLKVSTQLVNSQNDKENPEVLLEMKSVTETSKDTPPKKEYSLQSMLDNIAEGYVILDKEYRLVYFNQQAIKIALTVRTEAPKKGESFFEFVKKEQWEALHVILEKALTGQSTTIINKYTIESKRVVFEVVFSPFHSDHSVDGVIVNFKDISSRFEMQESLEASNARYELAARASFDIIWERNFEENCYRFNEAFAANLGYDKLVWVIEEFHKVITHPDDRVIVKNFTIKKFEQKETQFQMPVHRYIRKNGTIAYVDVRCIVIYTPEGKPKKSVGVVRDITERYLAEDELRKKNEQYDLATRASFDMIWDVDGTTKLLTSSDALERLFGYKLQTPMHYEKFLKTIVHPDDQQEVFNMIGKFVKSSDTFWELPVHRILKADGSVAFVLVRVMAIRNEEQFMVRMIGVSRDITNRYLAEQEMKRSNERYELMASLNYDVIMEVDFTTGKIYVNNIFKDFYGYDLEEYKTIEEAYRAIIHPDDFDRMMNGITNNRTASVEFADYSVFRLRKKDGTVVYCDTKSRFIRDKDGKPLKSLGIVRNITESYLAEQELRKSNERYRLASLASFDMLWERDFATDEYLFSDALQRLFGYDASMKWTSSTFQQVMLHPEDKGWVLHFVEECYDKKESIFQCPIHRYLKKDGGIAYVQVHCSVIYDEYGKPKRTVGVTRDITDQYLLERKLREANERNELVSKATTDLVWEWNYKTDELQFWNKGIEELFGYSIENNCTNMQWRFDRIHPDDLKQNMIKLKKLISNRESQLNCQYRFIDAAGKYHHVLDRAYISYDTAGNPERITGAIQDITPIKELEQKIAEEAILHQQQITEVTLLTQEKEREELGRELHDNINQLLAISLMYHSIALTDGPEQSRVMIEKSTEIIKKGVQEIRKLSKQLISPVLDMGLDEAIKELAEETSAASGIRFSLKKDESEYSTIPRHLQLMVYRIVQEQFNNILKHAKAVHVHISLSVKKNHLHMHISDDGVGFDDTKKADGIGLRNMRSRVKLYNGTIHISSIAGKGTKLDLSIPIVSPEKK